MSRHDLGGLGAARACIIGIAIAAMAGPALAQPRPPSSMPRDERPALDPVKGATFKCQGAPDLTAHFVSRRAELVAIVDPGDGAHELRLLPWKGESPDISWSDGRRTLTWSPGVKIMWMDGAVHRSCGRGGEHEH